MKRHEHLLTILAEECSEVTQRVSKALRFGLDEVQPGQELTNAERIEVELTDLFTVVGMLVADGHFKIKDRSADFDAKQEKVERFLAYSAKCGTLEPDA